MPKKWRNLMRYPVFNNQVLKWIYLQQFVFFKEWFILVSQQLQLKLMSNQWVIRWVGKPKVCKILIKRLIFRRCYSPTYFIYYLSLLLFGDRFFNISWNYSLLTSIILNFRVSYLKITPQVLDHRTMCYIRNTGIKAIYFI